MEKTVIEHDKVIHENILPRLKTVEDSQVAFDSKISAVINDLLSVQKGQKEMELTLMKEGQLNRELMNENKELTNKLLAHVLGKDEKETQAEIDDRKAKWELIGKVTVALFSGGSILYLIVEAVTK